MPTTGGSTHYRDELLELYDEYTALLALKQYLTLEDYEKVKLARVALRENPRASARKAQADLRKKIAGIRRQLRVKADRATLVDLLRKLEEGGEKTIVYVAKSALSDFADYSLILADFDRLPPHGRVGLSVRRANLERPDEMDLFVLEHRVYEDMCILFNLCRDRYIAAKMNHHWKPHDALLRATVVTTFSFVEAYLNGIADDYLLEHDNVDENTTMLLSEWDKQILKPKYVSLERKVRRYPSVYRGVTHPLVSEENCPALAVLMRMAKNRDALVHAAVLKRGQTSSKEDVFFQLAFDEVAELVDAAIGFVKCVEQEIGRNSLLLEWLASRDQDGRFRHDTE